MPPELQPSILIVDDEVAQMRALCNTLREGGYRTVGLTDGQSALDALRSGPFDVLLADLMMPGMDGITLLHRARDIDADIAGIIMTGKGTISSAVDAMKGGALDYILKPFKLSLILPVLERALAIRELRIANAELERSVRQRTIELETANKELEAFAHSISHDLRSPLMVVMGCAEQVTEEYGGAMPYGARQYIEKIMGGADRMKCLIDDLLRLSRIGRQPLEKHPVRIGDLMGDVLAEVKANYPGRDVDVQLGELHDCVGDPGLLKQVFVNLLSNAFKFTQGVAAPLIEVLCQKTEREQIYFVRDNGAGFDMKLARNLFGPFQRLHNADQFEGTGVGLSIVQRIVERHGGRIWADAALGRGATFHFSLPRS
jgi:signal transduction histidine kinase